jgi:hypothetical protein
MRLGAAVKGMAVIGTVVEISIRRRNDWNGVKLEVRTYPKFSLGQQQLQEELQMTFLHFI